jgi:type I restriction enzyme S subunit
MNLEGNEDELVTANNYIDEKVRVILSARCFPTGSVLFPKVGGAIATNKKRKVVRPSCADNNVMGLIPDASALDENYLFHWMKAQDLYEFSNKANPPSITQSAVRDWPISVPPLEEQKRIVAVLDQALAALDRARAHAEANLADAVELFDRYLSHEMSGIRRASGIPNSSGADIRLMKDIVTFHNGDRGKNYPNKSEYVVAGIPWINTGHIMEDGSLSEEKMNFISEAKFKQLGGGKTEVGDLVFCLRGATIGKTAFVGPYSPGAVASSLMIIRPGKEIVDKYAYYFLTSELGKSEIRRFIGGAAQPNLAGKSVGEFNVPLPSIEEQKRIVERIGAVQRNVEKSKRRYQQKLGDLANLRQSLLQKAFSGELT